MLSARQLLHRSAVASSSSTSVRSALPLCRRTFASSSTFYDAEPSTAPTRASGGRPARRDAAPARPRHPDPWDIQNLEPFKFDDTTSYGHWVLEKKREKLELLRAVEKDRKLLEKQRKTFTPPNPSTHYLRFSSFLSLTSHSTFFDPTLAQNQKRSLTVPIASLPLSSPEAIHRFKLLAGPRWVPPASALEPEAVAKAITKTMEGSQAETKEVAEEEHGEFKMSEESFPDGRMNRKWLSDVLDKLVEEANATTSELASTSSTIPLDVRHALARQRKKTGRDSGGHVWARRAARNAAGSAGGVRGFPTEWLWETAKGGQQQRSYTTAGGKIASRTSLAGGVRPTLSAGRRSTTVQYNLFSTSALRCGQGDKPEVNVAADSAAGIPGLSTGPFSTGSTSVLDTDELVSTLGSGDDSQSMKVNVQDGWASRSAEFMKNHYVGNQYSGRSITGVNKNFNVETALRRLNITLSRNKIKKELRLNEFYEKPSDKRQRLSRERHRRRFQEVVRKKVQLVQMLRNRP